MKAAEEMLRDIVNKDFKYKNNYAMTKQEKIKEIYTGVYQKINDHCGINGWIKKEYVTELILDSYDDFESNGNGYWRHKSLKGIEHNNGWTKIESEDDLPKEPGDYRIIYIDGEISDSKFTASENTKSLWIQVVTHWKPIIKELSPIY